MTVDLARLTVPVVAAPMAGGASTPQLVAAVNGAGGLGFLAAGYRSTVAMTEQIAAVRELTDRPFGMNLFVPAGPADPAVVAAYRARLLPEAERWGVELPVTIAPDRDDWDAQIAALRADPVPVVSYTFGLPTPAEAAALRAVGSTQIGTVTSAAAMPGPSPSPPAAISGRSVTRRISASSSSKGVLPGVASARWVARCPPASGP